MKIQKKQLEKVVRKIVLESLGQPVDLSDLYKVLGHKRMKAVKNWVQSGSTDMYDLPQDVMSDLYDFFRDEMPYGIQKAREGDPGIWLADRLEQMLGHDPFGESGMDLGKRQTNLPQSTAGAVPRPQKKKNPALNRTVMDMPRKEEIDLDTGAILEDAIEEV